MIIDAQVHTFEADTPERPWARSLPNVRPLPTPRLGTLAQMASSRWIGWATAPGPTLIKWLWFSR